MTESKNIAVIGAGTMGHGIAQVFASAGYNVYLNDIKDEFIQKGLDGIKFSLGKLLSKEKITQEQHDEILSRIKTTTDLKKAVKEADVVVEAIIENMDIKLDLFKKLDEYTKPETLLLSNTSTLSVTAMASATSKPDKVAGMHFSNPVVLMKGIEIVETLLSSKETIDTVSKLSESIGKIPVVVKDLPGFATNRLWAPFINEAIQAYSEGVATAEDMDKIVKLVFGHPMGPLALADLVGLDVILHIMRALQRELGDKYRPAPLLVKMVEAGKLGKKTKEGFYKY